MNKLDEIALRVGMDLFGCERPADVKYARALLAELSKDAEPVGYEFEDGTLVRAEFLQYFADKTGQKVKPLFIHPTNTEEIEQRVAEACANWVRSGLHDDDPYIIARGLEDGAWREHL